MQVHEGPLTEEFITSHDVAVITDATLTQEQLQHYNQVTHIATGIATL
jgi:hypothetical protein